MSKLVIYLLVILNFYCFCETIFTQTDLKAKKNEINVKLGEEFTLKFKSNPSTGYYWTFLNKNEASDSLQFLRSKYVKSPLPLNNIIFVGRGGYVYFYFKARKVTNEAQTLKFLYSRFSGKQTNDPSYIVKVNVN